MAAGGLTDDATLSTEANKAFSQPQRIPRKPIAGGSGSTAPALSTAEAGLPVTIDKTSLAETNHSATHRHEHLIRNDATSTPAQKKYVRWGITWRTPLLIVLWTLAGSGWAVGHHLYYRSLDGTRAGSSTQQHWAVNFGTALAFLVVASFRAACDIVYQQYIWTVFKRKTLSLDALDKLFSVTADPTAFLSWEFIRHAKIAFLVAIICWCMPLAGVTPSATLSVISGSRNETEDRSLASIDWTSVNFVDSEGLPSSEVLRIATLTAESMAPVSPAAPAVNSSFHVQFVGPTMQCSVASGSHQIAFDNYTKVLATDMIATKYLFESGKLKWGNIVPQAPLPLMNVYSAFSPMSGSQGLMQEQGLMQGSDSNGLNVDVFSNWVPGYGFFDSFYQSFQDEDSGDYSFVLQNLLIQTADQALVCTLGNASFDVRLGFVDSAPPLIQYTISKFVPLWMPVPPQGKTSDSMIDPLFSYTAVYLAFSSLVNGNVSTTLTNNYIYDSGPGHYKGQSAYIENYTFDGNATIYDGSSKVLQHGLSACDDFKLGYWNGNRAIGIGQEGPVPWQQAAAEMALYNSSTGSVAFSLGDQKITNISNDLFTKPPWMCRNRTLLRAVEDLANNITISMLSSEKLIKQNATTVPVLFFPTENIYRYDSRNLIVSYSIAASLTLISACIGFFALHYNGVAHSTTFSAIVATTRNHDLDAVSRGHSLGALPLQHTSMKVRFGEFVEGKEQKVWEGDDEGVERRSGRHIGFGAADKVVKLRKGGKYV